MRSPGILGWEREDDYMDWREAKEHNHSHNHHQPTGSPSTRHRRKSKEELSLRKESKDSFPTSVSASSASGSVSASAAQHQHPHYNNYHNSNVFSPLRVPTEHPAEEQEREEEEELLPKLPAMRLDQRHTNRHKEEAKIAIDHLIRPSCLESIINNRHQKLSVDDNCSREIINNNEEELGNLISTLLVTVERKIERVNLDDLVFPCPACRNIDTDDPLLGCKCAGPEECTNEHGDNETCHCGDTVDNCHSFEVAGIKHIDSDDEEEVRMGFGEYNSVLLLLKIILNHPIHVLLCMRIIYRHER